MHVKLLRCVVSRELSGYMSFYISFSYCKIREANAKSEHSGLSCGFVTLHGRDQIHKEGRFLYIYMYAFIIITFLSFPYSTDIPWNVSYIRLLPKHFPVFSYLSYQNESPEKNQLI